MVFKKALPLLLGLAVLFLIILLMQLVYLFFDGGLPVWANKGFTFLQNKLMWNAPLRVMLESYLITCIANLNIMNKDLHWDSIENGCNSAAALLTCTYMVLFPVWIYWFLNKMNGQGWLYDANF